MALDRIKSHIGPVWDDPQARSNQYLKKNAKTASETQASFYASSIQSLTPSVEKAQAIQLDTSKSSGLNNQKKGFWNSAWDWVKNKWNSFLEIVGLRKPTVQATERDRNLRTKILQRNSPVDIEDDFKYLDMTTVDPLKVMLAILVRQGELREEQAFLIQQKILLRQEDLKDWHDKDKEIHAELAMINKRGDILEKVNIGVTVAQVISGIA